MKGFVMGFVFVIVMSLLVGVQVEFVKEFYDQSCIYCYVSGVVGVFKIGDQVVWKLCMDKGMDMLVKYVEEGYNVMFSGGMCGDCFKEDYCVFIEYMIK